MNTNEIPGTDPRTVVTALTMDRAEWQWSRDMNDQLARAAIPQPVTVTRVARD